MFKGDAILGVLMVKGVGGLIVWQRGLVVRGQEKRDHHFENTLLLLETPLNPNR